MKIHTNSHDRLIARLDRADMERYEIGFGSLDINDVRTEKLINDLLSLSELPLTGKAYRLNIDAVFSSDGELFIILTLSRSAARRVKRMRLREKRYLCTLISNECLFSLCDALKPYRDIITESRLYCDGISYAVEISQKPLDKINLKHILSEFGSVRSSHSRVTQAYINEHCSLICADFIEKLSS